MSGTPPPTQTSWYYPCTKTCGEWRCPVCDADVAQEYRSGRRRVYCTNACRQRAYRWRRHNQVFTTHTNARPAERAYSTSGTVHALRSQRDFVARQTDSIRREVTVCGILARPARHTRLLHYRFTTGTGTCATCDSLTFAEPTPPFRWPMTPAPRHPPQWPLDPLNRSTAGAGRAARPIGRVRLGTAQDRPD